MSFQRVAIVTGGASGLGLGTVKRFASRGMDVAILDIAEEAGQEQVRLLRESGSRVAFFQVDVTDQQAVQCTVADAVKTFGRVDVLVNAAGIIRRTHALDVTPTEFGRILDVNVKGTVFASQAVQPYLIEVGGGAIVNFSSMLAHYGSENLLCYAASKGAVVQVTKCLAVEWAKYGIRVNAVSPGYIETPLSSGSTQDPNFRSRILSRTPQRRFGTTEEVAVTIDFLCSPEASFITGVVLPVDGGLLAGDPDLFPPVTSTPL